MFLRSRRRSPELSRTSSGPSLPAREEAAISSQPTENSEAHQLYLKGRYFWNKRTSDGLRKSISYFKEAIEKDPVYGPAYAGLADAYSVLPNYSQTPGKEAYPKADATALKALEIDDNQAEPEFKKGLQLDPNYSTGHQWYSIYLSVTGRLGEAISEMEKARELDPFSIIITRFQVLVQRIFHASSAQVAVTATPF